MAENAGLSRRIGIEVVAGVAHLFDVRRRVRASERLVGSLLRRAPFPIRMRRTQMLRACRDPLRAFGMSRRRVFRRPLIVEKDHARARTIGAKLSQ